MTIAIPTNEPKELRAGLTWAWDRQDLSDYPAPTWTMKYWFKRMGGTDKFSITATANGSFHRVAVLPAVTLTYVADDYTWVVIAGDGTNSYEVDRGTLKVLPRYDVDTALDDRTHAKKVLEAIEAVIEGRATKDQEEFTIGNRSLKRTPIADLLVLHDRYKREVAMEEAAEQMARGLGNPRNVGIRFSRP